MFVPVTETQFPVTPGDDKRPHTYGSSAGRYWEMVQRLKINQFYGAPTAIRLLLKYGDQWVQKYDRSTLKTLGSGTTKVIVPAGFL